MVTGDLRAIVRVPTLLRLRYVGSGRGFDGSILPTKVKFTWQTVFEIYARRDSSGNSFSFFQTETGSKVEINR